MPLKGERELGTVLSAFMGVALMRWPTFQRRQLRLVEGGILLSAPCW